MRVLTVNAGSSSLKLALIDEQDETIEARELDAPGARVDPDQLREALGSPLGQADAIGHRIVHGGRRFHTAVRIDEEVEGALRELSDLAPLHQPKSLAALDAAPPLRPPGGGARAWGAAPLRLPRPPPRWGGAPRAPDARRRRPRAADRQLPPRCRRLPVRDRRRRLARHDDGLNPARGPGDGHALR